MCTTRINHRANHSFFIPLSPLPLTATFLCYDTDMQSQDTV